MDLLNRKNLKTKEVPNFLELYLLGGRNDFLTGFFLENQVPKFLEHCFVRKTWILLAATFSKKKFRNFGSLDF